MSKSARILLVVLGLLPLAILVYGYLRPIPLFGSQQQVRDAIAPYGIWAPAAFVLLQVLQVVITPISHVVVGLAGGFMFGPSWGSVYNWLGRFVGTMIAFSLGRYVGRPLLHRLVRQETLEKYDGIWDKSASVLFLMYFLPAFPDDELSYIVGASRMPIRTFAAVAGFGVIGGSAVPAYVGSGADLKSPTFVLLLAVSVLAFFAYVWIRQRLRARQAHH